MKTGAENADMIRFGKRIVELRASKNVTQEELAAKLGVSRVVMGYFEQGRRSPSFATQRRLARTLGVTMSELFMGL
jgi:transcriptional regulator with XRE-family HTH domain